MRHNRLIYKFYTKKSQKKIFSPTNGLILGQQTNMDTDQG